MGQSHRSHGPDLDVLATGPDSSNGVLQLRHVCGAELQGPSLLVGLILCGAPGAWSSDRLSCSLRGEGSRAASPCEWSALGRRDQHHEAQSSRNRLHLSGVSTAACVRTQSLATSQGKGLRERWLWPGARLWGPDFARAWGALDPSAGRLFMDSCMLARLPPSARAEGEGTDGARSEGRPAFVVGVAAWQPRHAFKHVSDGTGALKRCCARADLEQRLSGGLPFKPCSYPSAEEQSREVCHPQHCRAALENGVRAPLPAAMTVSQQQQQQQPHSQWICRPPLRHHWAFILTSALLAGG